MGLDDHERRDDERDLEDGCGCPPGCTGSCCAGLS
jgi:hypothetical protein